MKQDNFSILISPNPRSILQNYLFLLLQISWRTFIQVQGNILQTRDIPMIFF